MKTVLKTPACTRIYVRLFSILALVLAGLLFGCASENTSSPAVSIGTEGGTLTLADGFQLTILPEAINEPLKLNILALSIDDVLSPGEAVDVEAAAARQRAVDALPNDLSWYSTIYQLEIEGAAPDQASLSLPLPPEESVTKTPFLATYGWDGAAWHWLPGRVDRSAGVMLAQVEDLPTFITVLSVAPTVPAVAVAVLSGETLPPEAEDTLTVAFPAGFHLQSDGRVQTDPSLPDWLKAGHQYTIIPAMRNWEEKKEPNIATLMEILTNPTARQRHIATLTQLATAEDYPALLLDYRGLPAKFREDFSAFIAELADALHTEGRQLFIRVELPHQVSTSRWETGVFDWSVLGRVTDMIQIPAPLDPADYATGGSAESLLNWATSQVDRRKLQWVVSAANLTQISDGWLPVSNEKALVSLGLLQADIDERLVTPGENVTFNLGALTETGIHLDEMSGLFQFETTSPDTEPQQVWLMSSAGLTRRMTLVDAYGLAGLVVENMPDVATDYYHLWPALVAYRTGLPSAETPQTALIWQVQDSTAAEPVSVKVTGPQYQWLVPKEPAVYTIAVALMVGDGTISQSIPVDSLTFAVPTPTPAPTPTLPPTATPIPRPTATPTRAIVRTPTPRPSNNCPAPDSTNITYPLNGSTIQGIVPFQGTAHLDNLKYYKFEYKPASSDTWQYLTKFDYTWVTNGKLMDFYTSTIAPGVYDFRLIVVSMSGDYPEPCAIRLNVRR